VIVTAFSYRFRPTSRGHLRICRASESTPPAMLHNSSEAGMIRISRVSALALVHRIAAQALS
jgi:hypothetical protein